MTTTHEQRIELEKFVLGYVDEFPGSIQAKIAADMRDTPVNRVHGNYNRVAWSVINLRRQGFIKDDAERCVCCHRVLNKERRPLYITEQGKEHLREIRQ